MDIDLSQYGLNPNVALEIPNKDQWLIAFVDMTCRPETEVWMFASWEGSASTNGVVNEDDGQKNLQARLLRQLIKTMKSLPIPTSLHQDILDAEQAQVRDDDLDASGRSRAESAAHMMRQDIMLLGAIHEKTAQVLAREGFIIRSFPRAGMVPNHMYTFAVDTLPNTVSTTLPEDLRWGTLSRQHFALVRVRTQIPRQDKTLAVLPNVAIFEAEGPVAWAFVGLDGSLSTLHVEPEYRGKGLAKAVMAKLFKEKMDLFWEEGVERVAHDYVIKGNEASVGVSKSMGGKSEWEVFWCRMDLGALDS